MKPLLLRYAVAGGTCLGICAMSADVAADEYYYVDWTTADVAAGTASGVIRLPDGSMMTVTFAARYEDGSPGNLYGAQVDGGGTNYWTPDAPYLSEQVENAPPDSDILRLSGGQNQVYEVTLSEPIKDPIMAIVSLGQPSVPTSYDFDAPFTIVSQGAGYWGGSDTALQALEGDVLQGSEGHGTIQFIGTFATFSWTVPTPETWHGFTFGVRTVERLEPEDPDAGDAGGGSISPDGGPDELTDSEDDFGCSCRISRQSNSAMGASGAASLAVIALVWSRKRRRA